MKQKYHVRFLILLTLASTLFSSCMVDYKLYSTRSRPSNQIPGGFVYALPRTQVRVGVTFDKVDYSCAPYWQFAGEMLGLKGVNVDSVFSIHSIEIATYNIADPDLYYFVDPGHTAVTIDNRGLLRSIGVGDVDQRLLAEPDQKKPNDATPYTVLFEKAIQDPVFNLYNRTDTFYVRNDPPGRPSLIVTKKDTRSLRQRALAVAEQIEQIRVKQQELLFGEYDGDYNAVTLQYLYQQLEKQEQLLIEQFVGRTTTETVYFDIDPMSYKEHLSSQTYDLFRFNAKQGIVDSTVADATVVRCNITCVKSNQKTLNFVRFRTGPVTEGSFMDLHTFKYRIPETADVSVFSDQFRFNRQVKISQFGTIATLPYGKYKALFDPNTSDLIYFDIK